MSLDTDREVVRLLSEILNSLRESSEERKRLHEESQEMLRRYERRQKGLAAIVCTFVVFGVAVILLLIRFAQRQQSGGF